MDWFAFLDSYKAMLGGVSIALATMFVVMLNLNYNEKDRLKKKKDN